VSSRDGELSVLLGVKLRNLAVRSLAVFCGGVDGGSRVVVLESVTGDLRRAFSLARRASSGSGILVCGFEVVVGESKVDDVVVWNSRHLGDPGRVLGSPFEASIQHN
jgi:hypothetical protein